MHRIKKIPLTLLAIGGLVALGTTPAAATADHQKTITIAWEMPGSVNGSITWPQKLATNGVPDCGDGWYQVDTYRYATKAERAKVKEIISDGILTGPEEDGPVYLEHRIVTPGNLPELCDPEPPVQPPVEPPVEDPPVEEPPVIDPPVEEPPIIEPPTDEPPIEEPPAEEPPVDEPPVDEPPVDEPPVKTPPVKTPPTDTPPVVTPPVTPVVTPPVVHQPPAATPPTADAPRESLPVTGPSGNVLLGGTAVGSVLAGAVAFLVRRKMQASLPD